MNKTRIRWIALGLSAFVIASAGCNRPLLRSSMLGKSRGNTTQEDFSRDFQKDLHSRYGDAKKNLNASANGEKKGLMPKLTEPFKKLSGSAN
jgi:hypothetical protein